MNGLINPIKHFFRKKVDQPAPSPIEKEFNEPLTIPSEHSNRVPSHFYQDENDEDYFVYKLEPDDNKWANWDHQSRKHLGTPGYYGAQVSDTVRNSNIHVFPDRQDLVNPSVGRATKYGDKMTAQNYYGQGFASTVPANGGFKGNLHLNPPSEDEKDQNLQKILPSYLLDETEQITDQNKFKANNQDKVTRQSSDFQAYSRILPQGLDISRIEPKKSIDDYSAIISPKKPQKPNLDDSEDMNMAQVIKTLEKNIAKAKAYRKTGHGNSRIANSKHGLKINVGLGKKQDDTLSLEQSSAADTHLNMGESQDLRAKFLKGGDTSRTVFYSFASTDKHTSGIANAESPYQGNMLYDKPNNGRLGGNNFNFPVLARIEEETISAKTFRPEISPSGTRDHLFSHYKESAEPNPLARLRFSEPTLQGMDSHRTRNRQMSTQVATQPGMHARTYSQPMNIRTAPSHPMPKTQPSENYILCINCNDLISSYVVDQHSVFCNESMAAGEDLSSEVVLETKNPQVTLERCNLRLRKLKVLIEKNLKNLKGQVQIGIVMLEEQDTVFSITELITRIGEEVIKNDKVPSKLSRDVTSIANFKEDLAPFIDIVLAGIITNNIELFIRTARGKEKALDLVLKKEKEQRAMYPSYYESNDSRNSMGSKLDYEKLRLSSMTTPNKGINKPSSYSYKPLVTGENYGQSTAGGSSLNSQRMTLENRLPLSGDWADAVTKNSHRKGY